MQTDIAGLDLKYDSSNKDASKSFEMLANLFMSEKKDMGLYDKLNATLS